MSRLLFLCLLLNIKAFGADFPPFSPSYEPISPFSVFFLADTIPPTITCPPSDTIVLAPGKCDTAYNYTVLFSDDQPNPILIQLNGIPSGGIFPVGETVNVFLVTDLAGNTATCSFNVVVQPNVGTLICQDVVFFDLGSNCTTEILPEDVLDLPIPGCVDEYVVEIDKVAPYGNGPVPATVGAADVGKIFAFRVRDPFTGNSCFGSVEINLPPPTVACQSIIIHCAVDNLAPNFLKDSVGLANAFPVASSNCPGTMLTFFDLPENLPCDSANNISGIVNRIWKVTDAVGQTATCQQTIFRRRSFLGVQFPANASARCSDENNIALTGAPVVKEGNKTFPLWPASFCEIDVNYFDTLFIQYCGGGRQVVRTWKVYDLCQPVSPDNPLTGIQLIDFVDDAGPTIVCDSTMEVVINANNCEGPVDLPDVLLSDDCSNIESITAYWSSGGIPDSLVGTLTIPDTMGIFGVASNFPIGITLVQYVAKDECGNTGTCELALMVTDSAAPTASCISFLPVYLSPQGDYLLDADSLDLGSSAACGQPLFFKVRRAVVNPNCASGAQFDDTVGFCCSDAGDTVEVVLRVYDIPMPDGPISADSAQNQSDDCTVKIWVQDTLAAFCVAPPNVTTDCINFDPTFVAYGEPTATCSVDSLSVITDYTQFDTVCTKGKIIRIFQVFGQNGQSSECIQQITVSQVQDYYIKFPDDLVVFNTCDSAGNYGVPEFLQNGCENLKMAFEDEIFTVVPDACYKIERTWWIYNECTYDWLKSLIVVPNPNPNPVTNHPDNLLGPVVSRANTPTPWSPSIMAIAPGQTPTNYSTFWDSASNGYQYKQIIKIIDNQDPVITNCPTGTPVLGDTAENNQQLWNQAYWWDPATESHDLCEGPSPLSITASDLCSGADLNVSYLLFLDLDSDDTPETVINSNNAPSAGTVNYGNIANPNYSGGTPRAFDGRPVAFNDIYRWALHETVNGNQLTMSVQWKTFAQLPTPANPLGSPGIAPELPYGTHKIRWIVTDGCGNEAYCDYFFEVKDTKAPTVVCLQDTLTINILPPDLVQIFAVDLFETKEDNCTPPDQIKIGTREAGQGAGFPVDANGDPVTSVVFSCDELGFQNVEIWGQDLAGNAGFCTVVVNIQDSFNYCGDDPKPTVAGFIKNELDAPVVNANLFLNISTPQGGSSNLQTQTDPQGEFAFLNSLPHGSDYTLTPMKDIGHLNGVSTFDLVLISKHILALDTLDSPYKMIAADANKSNSITTFDVVEIRKLILGIYNELPNNTSWRFVDEDFVFPNPLNPFASPFPESITRTDVFTDQAGEDFVGIKVGDVNNTVNDDSLLIPNDRADISPFGGGRGRNILFFHVNNRDVQRDEEFTVHFSADEKVLGYQFTLNINGLEVLEVLPSEELAASNFAVFEDLSDGLADAVTTSVENGARHFAIKFRARKAGLLSEMLAISSRITKAEAYLPAEASAKAGKPNLLDVALLFDRRLISKVGFELYQNQPNPFSDATLIGFHLPEANDATLTVFDETGRVLHTKSASYARGYHSVSLEKSLFDRAGVFFYKLETPTESAVRKMVVLR